MTSAYLSVKFKCKFLCEVFDEYRCSLKNLDFQYEEDYQSEDA